MKPLTIGFSPCPNDTFIFNRLVHTSPPPGGPLFQSPFLEDVETLNQWAFEHRLDVTKLSYHAAGARNVVKFKAGKKLKESV